jgi:hypothetical protein
MLLRMATALRPPIREVPLMLACPTCRQVFRTKGSFLDTGGGVRMVPGARAPRPSGIRGSRLSAPRHGHESQRPAGRAGQPSAFFSATSRVFFSSSVGLNSTTSVPANNSGVWGVERPARR